MGQFLSRLIPACVVGVGILCALNLSVRAQDSQPAAASAAPAAEAKPTAPASSGYYVEFRAAEIGAYGHSYAVYGRLNGRGQPADAHYTDLHPMGNYAIMALGHVLPVPANTQWDPDVLKLRVSSAYRKSLNPTQYQRLLAAVARHRADRAPIWNAVTNNCNHYMAQLAQAVGLRAPHDFQFSVAFIPAMRDLNESGAVVATPRASAPRRTAAPADQKPKS
jgi:hypothetical protein